MQPQDPWRRDRAAGRLRGDGWDAREKVREKNGKWSNRLSKRNVAPFYTFSQLKENKKMRFVSFIFTQVPVG